MLLRCVVLGDDDTGGVPQVSLTREMSDESINSLFFRGKTLFDRLGRPFGVIAGAWLDPNLSVHRVVFTPLEPEQGLFCMVDLASAPEEGRNGLRLPVLRREVYASLRQMQELWRNTAIANP